MIQLKHDMKLEDMLNGE